MMAAAIRVLYVDDEPDLLDIGKLFLEESGDFTVTTALSAPEAIRLLEQEKFDAIISDYQMPGMDGIQFLVEVRTRFGPTPFILFTGRGREEIVIQAINSGADFYLQKGGEPGAQFAELTHKIKAAASGKRADDALRKSEEKYRHLIEHANEAIVVVQDGMPKLVNHQTVEFTGYSEQELLSMSISAFIHPDDRAMVVERYQERMNGEELPSHYAFRLSSKDGRTRWVEISVVVIDWEGRPATLNFLTDITERNQAEEALRKSEEKFRKAFFTSPDSICITRLSDGMFISINKGFTEITGYTEEDVAGKTSLEINVWKDQEDRRKIVEELKAKGEVRNYEARFLTKTGEITGLMSTSIIELNGVPHILNITHDITDRKHAEEELLRKNEELHASFEEITATEEELRANLDELTRQEEALRESKRELADIIEFLPDATFVIDRQAIVIAWNRAMEEMTGVRAKDMLGKGNYEYAIPFYGERRPILIDLVMMQDSDVLNKYSSVQKSGDSLTAETNLTRLGGKDLHLWGKSVLIKNSHGEVVGAIESIRDITAWKHTEMKLVSAKEHLKEAYHLAHIGTWDWIIKTDTVTWSEELCTIAGWDPSLPAPTYADLPRIYSPASWEQLSAAVTNALNTGEPYNLDLEMIRPDGTIRWTNAFGGVIRDTKGKITGLHGTVQDITESKRAEAALAESFATFRTVMDSIDALVYVADMKTYEILFVNEYGRKIWGDISGKICWEALQVNQRGPCPFCTNNKLLDSEGNPARIVIWEFKNTINGHWYECHDSAIRWTDGRIVRIEIATDITKRKWVEEEIAESEDRFRGIFDTITSGVAIYEVLNNGASGKDYIIKDFNKTALEIEGKTKEEIVGKSLFDLRPAIDEYGLIPVFQQVWKTGVPAYFPQKVYIDEKYSSWYENRVFRLHSGEIVAVYDDVTERKRAEEALKESEFKYRSLIESSSDAIFCVDQQGTYKFTNQVFASTFNKTPEFFIGKTFWDIYPKEHADYRQLTNLAVFETGVTQTIEVEVPLPDTTLYFIAKANPIKDESGKVILNLTHATDITGRKTTEKMLLETTEYLQNLFDYANAPIIVWDPEYVITRFNHAFEDLTLISEQEAIGQKLDILFPEESRDASLIEIKKTLEGERWKTVEIPILVKDGSVRTVLWNSANILDIHGRITSTIAQGVDITDRKEAGEALKEREQDLVEAQKIAQLGKWDLDLVNNTLHWSDGIYEMFEINPALFGATYEAFLNCIHPDDRDMVNSAYTGSLKNRQPYEISHRLRMMDGRIKWVNEICHTEYNSQGQPLRSVGIVQDISRIKQAEEALILANKKLNLLSSITRHDINNQLSVLRGYISILEKKLPDPALSDYFLKSSTAAQRISSMIQFTKEYEDIGVNAPVWKDCDNLIDTATKQAPLGMVTVINEIPAGTKIFADPLIVKVFFNLMDNAVRHGGKITTIRFSSGERGADHILVCEDDGDGVLPEEKEKIFLKGYGKNTGMGLFLSREILSITGITIRETGEPGKGARFEITVPKGAWRTASKGA